MKRRQTQDERVRASTEALLDAALEMVAERGFAGASPALIAARAGYDRKMVHHRFGSKEGMFRALLERSFRRPILAPITDPDLSGLNRAVSTMSALQSLWREDQRFVRAVFTIAFQTVDTSSDLSEMYESWLVEARDAVASALFQGQRDGSVKSDLDVPGAAQVAVDATIGLIYRWSLRPNAVDLENELENWVTGARSMFGT